MAANASDDDLVGFVFGYKSPTGGADNPRNFYLFATRRLDITNSFGTTCKTFFGYVNGSGGNMFDYTPASNFITYVCDSASTFHGWVAGQTYNFTCLYTSTHTQIYINGTKYIDINGCFQPGRFGFYNYSQGKVTYSNFKYQVIADFSIANDSLCFGDTAKCSIFCNPSFVSPYTSTKWEMGDGTTISNMSQISHIYQAPGVYNIKLIIEDVNGCKDSVTKSITVFKPTANFNFTNVCNGDAMDFNDNSNSGGWGNVTSWNWNFGDGTGTSTQQNPNYTYANAGQDSVQLIVRTSNNCADTIKKQVTVYPNPNANFNFTNVCDGDSMVFANNSSISGGGTINSWDWNFGDGTGTSTQQNPNYTYANAGQDSVQLIVRTSNNCADTIKKQVTVYPNPIADFSFTNVCDGDSMVFANNSSISGGGTINSWNWNFGDGTGTSTQQNPNYTYANAGQDSVQLIVRTSNNCADTIKKQVTVYPNPNADFNADTACYEVATLFTDESTVSNGNISTWNWDFGDGTGVSTQQNPTYTYANEGSYQVQLTVKTNHNCIDSITKTIVVNPLPDPNFTGTNLSGCTPWCVNLTDSSSISSGSIINWEWNVGNDSNLTGSSLIHCYNNSDLSVDTYPISLTVTSDKGCKATITKNNFVSIYPRPKPAFTMNPNPGDIYHNKIHFINQSMGADSWTWDFGNGIGMSNEQSPLYVYGDTGTYVINLKVTNQWNCSDSTSELLRINPVFAFFIPNAFSPDGDGLNDTFYPKGFGIRAMTMFIFNRWGEMIYHSKGVDSKWNGIYENKLVPPGVYVYKIVVLDEKGDSHIYTGSVTVIR